MSLLMAGGLELDEVPSNPYHSMVLWLLTSSWSWGMCHCGGSSPHLPLELCYSLLWTPGRTEGQRSADHCLDEVLSWADLRSKPRPEDYDIISSLEHRLAYWTPWFFLLPLDKLGTWFQVPPLLSTPVNYNCHLESGGASKGLLSQNNLII